MDKEILKKIDYEISRFTKDTDDYLGVLYYNIFHQQFNQYYIYYDKNDNLKWTTGNDDSDFFKIVGSHIGISKMIDKIYESMNNQWISGSERCMIFPYGCEKYIMIYSDNGGTNILMTMISGDGACDCIAQDFYTNDIDNAFKILSPVMCKFKEDHNKIEFGIATVGANSEIYTSWYDYKKTDIDIKLNYNDDLPYGEICDLIEGEGNPELLLFYGEPGTGKSSLLKHLISKYKEKSFIFMDGAILANVQQQKLMSYFLENDHSIFILEDCEKSLMSREHYDNPVMPTLLNITDGITADVLGIKLICTFNTDFEKIDKALRRKGRLSLKYEFRKLDKAKVRKILNDETINEDMTLADIYYYKKENDFSKKKAKKIGF